MHDLENANLHTSTTHIYTTTNNCNSFPMLGQCIALNAST